MTFERLPKGYLRTWENYDELLRYVIENEQRDSYFSSRNNSRKRSWDLEAGWDGAVEMSRNGWADGLLKMEQFLESIEHITGSIAVRPETHYDVTGDYVDIGRYVTGEPECMAQFHETEIPQYGGKIVRVAVSINGIASFTAEQLFKRGAAAVALVDALENAGRQCEIVMVVANIRGDTRLEYSCVIKKAGEAVELDRLAFALAHPAMWRRLIFAAMELEPMPIREQIGACDGGYGRSVDAIIAYDGADVIVRNDMAGMDTKQCIEWVMKELKKQGVEIREAVSK